MSDQEHTNEPEAQHESPEQAGMADLDMLIGQLEQSVEEAPPEPEFNEDQDIQISPVLEALDPARRPAQGSVCESCPNSVWMVSPDKVQCYCRVMFVIVCSTKEPNMLLACDGITLGQEEG